MELSELFDRPPTLREVSPSEVLSRFSINADVAYEAEVNGESYLFTMEDTDGRGEWAFTFGIIHGSAGDMVSFAPTNEKHPYPVLAAAVEVLRRVLTTERPYVVKFTGHFMRHNQLYAAMVKMLRTRLPRGYEIEEDDGRWSIKRDDLYETKMPRAPRLTFADAKEFVADLETGRGRIAEVIARNPWLREECQQAARKALGGRFAVYRAVSPTEGLRPDKVASTSLDPKVPISMLISAPGIIFTKGFGDGAVIPKKRLLRYDITPEQVVCWVPHVIETVKAALGSRINQSFEDRYGGRVKMSKFLATHADQDEQEIVADLHGLKPKMINADGVGILYAASWLLRGVPDDKIIESWLRDGGGEKELERLRKFFAR
jgi:hypothetical protein